MVDREFNVNSFPAFDFSVNHVLQLKTRNVLLVIGYDTETIVPSIKIFNLDKIDKNGIPLCLKVLSLQKTSVPVTCFVALEDLSQIAVGLCNGCVMLIYGDILRNPQQRIIQQPGDQPITGLGFKEVSKLAYLFVVTTASIVSYCTSRNDSKDKLDELGCELGCSVLSEDLDMVIGRKEAVYFYEYDSKGPCFAFDGHKKILHWFRSYLIIISEATSSAVTPPPSAANSSTSLSSANAAAAASASAMKTNTVDIYDLKNKFVAYHASCETVNQVIAEWGSIFLLTKNGKLYQLIEHDTQSKLESLYKWNLYPVAINLAYSAKMGSNAITDIFRKYGDYLYEKGEFDSAMLQYIKTIGNLEPSYVIRKYLDAQRIHNLTLYLQSLHEKDLANSDHTTLLLNCYTKLKDAKMLDQFIMTNSEVKFDVNVAIKVARQAGYHKHALYLAEKHDEHELYLKILLEDLKDYRSALDYIYCLDFFEAEKNFTKYGKVLVSNLPEESTNVLIKLCTNYIPRKKETLKTKHLGGEISFQLVDEPSFAKSNPEKFIHAFVNQPDQLIKFLEIVIEARRQSGESEISSVIYNTLLELYLRNDDLQMNPETPVAMEQKRKKLEKAFTLLKNPNVVYDVNHALFLVQLHDYQEGILYLYEKLELYEEIVQYHMENNNYNFIIEACEKFGTKNPTIWTSALSYFAGMQGVMPEEQHEKYIKEILVNIERDKLLSPLLVIQILCQNSQIPLSVVEGFLKKQLQDQSRSITIDKQRIRELSEEMEKMKVEIDEMQSGAKIFQLSKCSLCTNQLDLPAVHFMCMHSFHQRCLRENEVCIICEDNYEKVRSYKRAINKETSFDKFNEIVQMKEDSFSAMADFFGRGIFNNRDDSFA